MTTGQKLASLSSLGTATAIDHLKNIFQTDIVARESFISEDTTVTLLAKDDIISLKNIAPSVLKSRTEDETKMEELYGLRENS